MYQRSQPYASLVSYQKIYMYKNSPSWLLSTCGKTQVVQVVSWKHRDSHIAPALEMNAQQFLFYGGIHGTSMFCRGICENFPKKF